MNRLPGHRSGALVVQSRYVDDRTGEWCLCKCDCGRTASVRDARLDGESRVSCGDPECPHRAEHEHVPTPNARYVYDYDNGYRVGSLVVVSPTNDGTARFNVVCDCGKELVVFGALLHHGTDGTTCGRECPTKRRRNEGHKRRRVPDLQKKRHVVQVLLPVEIYVELLEDAAGQDLSAHVRGIITDHLLGKRKSADA